MKKIAIQMLMLVMALVMSQTAWADSKEKRNNDKVKPNVEHRGRGFNQAKWDSIKALHPNLGHRPTFDKAKMETLKAKMDSLKAKHPNMGHRPTFDKAKWDSIKALHSNMGHKMDSLKAKHPNFGRFGFGPRPGFGRPFFGHRPPFGHHFGHRPKGFHKHQDEEVVVTEEQAKAPTMDATAISQTRKSDDAPTYDLNGRLVQGQTKGITIRNGKKYIK